VLATGAGCSSSRGASFAHEWGEVQEDREGNQAPGGADEQRNDPTHWNCAKDLRKSFGKTEIIRGANLAVKPGERVAIIGPNGAGKSTLFNLISGRFAQQRRGPAQRQRIDGLQAVRDQPRACRAASRSPTCSAAVGVREPALRGAVEPGATATPSGVPGRPARRQRARRAS
jgi:hypothetical protein